MDLRGKVIRISPSAAGTYKDCPLMYKKKYIEGRVSNDKKDGEALYFGSSLHRSVEGFNPRIFKDIHEEKTGAKPDTFTLIKAKKHFWNTLPAKTKPVHEDLKRILPEDTKNEVFIYMPFPRPEVAGAKWVMECHIDFVWNQWKNCGDLKTSTKPVEVALPPLMKAAQSYMYLWAIGTGNFSYFYAQRPTINQKTNEEKEAYQARCMEWLKEKGKTAERVDLQYTKQQVELYLLQLQAQMVHSFKHDIFPEGSACRKYYSPCDYYDDCFKNTPMQRDYNVNGFTTNDKRIKITDDHWCIDYLGQEIPDNKNYRKKNDYRELYKTFYEPEEKQEEVIEVADKTLKDLAEEPMEGILDVVSTEDVWNDLIKDSTPEQLQEFRDDLAKRTGLTSLKKMKDLIARVVNSLVSGKMEFEEKSLPWIFKHDKEQVLENVTKSDRTYIESLEKDIFGWTMYKKLKGEL